MTVARLSSTAAVALALLGATSAQALWPFDGGSSSELKELRETQQKILERLDAQDKMLRDILGRMAARPVQPDPNRVHDIPVTHSPVRGPKDAPVTLVEFSDFQCPFCARSIALAEDLLKKYPKDVRFVYKHMPLTQIHPNAMPAAKAAVAAANQGKFWEMHDELFENYRELSADNIRKIAGEIGLDMKRFEQDLGSPETEKLVQEDMALGGRVGVRGTPTFFLNGRQIQNRSPEALKGMVDGELKKKSG
ncbi:MAG: DsbA family protein [Candidatus Binatia bacterium]